MENNDDSDYIPKKSKGTKGSANSSRPKRYCKAIVKYEDSFQYRRHKRKSSRSQSKKFSGPIIYQCSLCSFQTNFKSKLKHHFIACSRGLTKTRENTTYNVTADAKFRCEYCPFETGTLNDLLSHKDSHTKLVASGVIECSHCNLTFFTVEECKTHMNLSFLGSPEKNEENRNDYVDASVNENLTIKVEECSNEKQSPALVEEEDISANEREKVVVVCDDFDCEQVKQNGLYLCPCEKFQTHCRSNYLRHLKFIHNVKRVGPQDTSSIKAGGDEKKSLSCLICRRQADSQLQMAVHTALDHVKPGCPFTCFKPDCGFETAHKDELKGHLMEAHKLKQSIFHPLNDAYSEGQQVSFTCSKCLHETKNEVYLKAHHLISHLKNSDAPFKCPWSECHKYLGTKSTLRGHLKAMHGMDVKDGTAVPPDQGWNPDGHLLSCRNCGHKSQTDIQMLIHRTFYHHPKGQKRFGCPLPKCYFNTYYKHHLRQHLKWVHKLGEEHFRDYGVDGLEERFESDVVQRVDENLDEVSNVNSDYGDKYLSPYTNNGMYNCGLCEFTSNHERHFWRHQSTAHHMRQCGMCEKTVWGEYQWFWHNYSVHKRVRNWEFYQRWQRCDLCGYEGTTKRSYKHGATHELPTVMFQTLYRNVPSGQVIFHYAEHKSSKIGLRNTVHEAKPRGVEDNEDCVAPSAIKMVDWTMRDEEGDIAKRLLQLGTEEDITIEVVDDSDVDTETQSNSGDPNMSNPPNHHDDLLIKVSEFLTCKECSFETQNAALLKVHRMAAHMRWKRSQKQQFRCSEDSCRFQSKYLDSLKRHLMKIHNYDRRYFWPVETMWRMTREMKDDDRRVRERDDEHATGVHASTNPEADPDWEPATVLDDHQYSKRKAPSPEMSADRGRNRGINKFCKPKFNCPNLHCLFDTDRKHDLKRHLEVFHKMEKDNVVELEDTEEFKRHFRAMHRSPAARAVTSDRVHSQEPPKWRLKCSHCPFETLLKRAAHRHGARHCHVPQVTFHKYEGNQRRGVLNYRYPNRILQTSTIGHNVGSRPMDSYKHNMRLRVMKGNNVETRLLRNKRVTRNPTRRGDSPELRPSKHMKVKRDSSSNKSENNRMRFRKKKDFVVANTYSDGDQEEAETDVQHTTIEDDTHEAIRIEITEDADDNLVEAEANAAALRLICKNKGCDYVFHDTDDIQKHAESCAKSLSRRGQSPEKFVSVRKEKEDFVVAYSDGDQEEAETDVEDNVTEAIRIEFTEDAVEAEANAAALRLICKNKGCDYVFHDTDDIPKHAESCAKSLSQTPEEFVCSLCETPFPDKNMLQNHIRYEHLINQEAKPKPKTKLMVKRHKTSEKIPGRVSFKCWMCGMSISTVPALRNHTYVHACEEDNLDLKVSYSKYKGDTRVDTIVITADPTYVPKSSRKVPLHGDCSARVRSPVLEYDPELPVFACAECNFKTNKEPELTRHKNLHWSKEKAAAFDVQKWFTCGVCYFHCFDAATFKEHADKHKSRFDTKIDVKKKVGKDS